MAGRTEEQRARKREREADKRIGRMNAHQPAPGPSIRENILADLDKAMEKWLDLKAEGYGSGDTEVAMARGEVRGLARAVGRFGWSGVSSYYPVKGMKAAEQQSLARVKAKRQER